MQARVEGDGRAEGRRGRPSPASEKLDYELFDRWIRFLAKPPKFYPYLKKWQAMIKDGGTEDEAKKLADEFQALLRRGDVRGAGDQGRERHHPRQGAAGTKKKEPANQPNEFVTNDDFCPGCGLELKSLPADRVSFWTRHVPRDLVDGADPANAKDESKPGAARRSAARRSSAGWAPIAAATSTSCATTSRRCSKAMPPKYAYVHGVQDVEKPAPSCKLAIRGNPIQAGRRGAAALPVGAEPTAIRRRSRRAAAGWSWPTRSCSSRSRCA